MDSAWIGLIGTLVGGVLVGGISIVLKILEMRFQRKLKLDELGYQRDKEDWVFLRSRLEELHAQLNGLISNCNDFAHFLIQDRFNHVGVSDRVARFATLNMELTRLVAGLNSLQRLYLPEGVDGWKKVTAVTQDFVVKAGNFSAGKLPLDGLNGAAQEVAYECIEVAKLIESKINARHLSLP